jgi:nucleoid-associated protein YgaU
VNPLTAAAAGSTLQGLAAAAGGDWQRIAAANGIDNPRQLVPGQLIDLAARLPRSLF